MKKMKWIHNAKIKYILSGCIQFLGAFSLTIFCCIVNFGNRCGDGWCWLGVMTTIPIYLVLLGGLNLIFLSIKDWKHLKILDFGFIIALLITIFVYCLLLNIL